MRSSVASPLHQVPVRIWVGVFNLVSGVAMLIASVLAGLLWNLLGAPFTF